MKDWTLMIYMAGDNNLSDDMITGLIGIENAARFKSGKIAVTVYYDSAAIGIPTTLYDFTDGTKTAIDESATSASSICDFVEWTVKSKRRRARNYALILSGHGEGYQPETFLNDQTPRAFVSVKDLGAALHSLTRPHNKTEKKKFTLGKKLAILGFDSCVMNTLEVAEEFRGATDMIVGSQGLVANTGWDYELLFSKLERPDAELDPGNVARTMCDAHIESSWPYVIRGGRSADISAIDLRPRKRNDFATVSGAVNELGEELQRTLKDENSARSIERILLACHWNCQTLIYDQAVDVADFCAILASECRTAAEENAEIIDAAPGSDLAKRAKKANRRLDAVTRICEQVVSAIETCVDFSYVGPEYQWAGGLSLYFPWSYRSHLLKRNAYLGYKLSGGGRKKKINGWAAFLDLYLAGTMRPIRKNPNSRAIAASLEDAPPVSVESKASHGTEIGAAESRWTQPINRWTQPINRWTQPINRWTQPINRWTQPINRGFGDDSIESFRRMKNFPWFPADWDSDES
ncbi:MAG: hypothetical protein IPJ30_05575 [Acidobacteria bacterium]|nr:hypothetical protein [Acidobacteriota bacterium]